MKSLMNAILLSALVFSAGCGKKKSEKEANPSIKGTYQAKVDFLMATLSETTRLGSSEYQFLIQKIAELRDLIPMNGTAQKYTLDNIQTQNWDVSNQPAIRIESVKTWILCRARESISTGEVRVRTGSSYYEYKHWDLLPRTQHSHVNNGSPFDYDRAQPQYAQSIGEIVMGPKEIIVYAANSRECGIWPRSIVVYTGFSGRTLAAVNGFKAAMESALKDLEEIYNNRQGNYPVSYMLKAVRSKIANAVSALP